MSSLERDPNKRRVKPVEAQASILDFDLEEESSDDSDFRIEDHPEVSDDDDESRDGDANSGEEEESDVSDPDELKNLSLPNGDGVSVLDVIKKADLQLNNLNEKDAQILICSGCLGDQSDGVNEIVECDSCGVTVHEACYGVSDTASLASTDSLSPTAPWFCEACRSGILDPVCELCPNSGGIFKETDVGKWVHLVCALYVPGVAFGEVEKLTSVTLFEMPYSKWGAKNCSLCLDERFARTGVCIGCDAGMCKTYFHVTCAQREGFLSEAHSEEVDQADPFYAHCKLHSDKTLVKKRRKNYLALQLRTHYRRLQFEKEGHKETPEQVRIQRKLEKQKIHFLGHKSLKPAPWVPTQKMPRLLTTSASACRKLLRKADLMGINTMVLEMQEAQAAALVDVRKKWHISPAFTVEFIAYYLDRNDRLKGMKDTLEKLLVANKELSEEQQTLRARYDELLKTSQEENKKNLDLKQTIHKYHSAILSACPTKNLPNIEDLGKPPVSRTSQPMMVPTAAALKMGVGFPLNTMMSTGRSDRVLSSHAKQEPTPPAPPLPPPPPLPLPDSLNVSVILGKNENIDMPTKKSGKKRRREKHKNRYSPELGSPSKEHKRKRKKKSLDIEEPIILPRITIKIKPIPLPAGEVASESNPQCFYVPNERDDNAPPPIIKVVTKLPTPPPPVPKKASGFYCDVCKEDGSGVNVVGCDDCKKLYHFTCLDPPLKKSPKRRGYSWQCADCDPTLKPPQQLLPSSQVVPESKPQNFYMPVDDSEPLLLIKHIESASETPRSGPQCDVCREISSSNNAVRCDECQKLYHFTCLDPPLKKSPKKRGYSWHCADCDPTGSE